MKEKPVNHRADLNILEFSKWEIAHSATKEGLAPPLIKLDPNSDFAGLRLIALMAYPSSDLSQKYTLATMGSLMLASAESMQEFSNLPFEDQIETMAERLGVKPDDVLSIPGTRDLFAEISQGGTAEKIEAWIMQKLFKPAGGHLSAGHAPGAKAMSQAIANGMRGLPGAAGLALVYCASIHKHHQVLTASLARSHAVVSVVAKRIGMKVPSDLRSFRAVWKEWGSVAPLWAAVYVNMAAHKALHLPMRDAFGNWNGELKQTLAYAAWFRHFATTHVPLNAKESLLATDEPLMLETGLAAQEPPLRPLAGDELAAARSHKAPAAA